MASGNGTQYLPGGGASKVPLWPGMYAASVVVSKDPQGLGRLRLQIPQVLGTALSGWAIPMVPFQGAPAIGAQVSAMFIGGDPTRPAWFGSLELTEPGTLITLGDGPPTTPGTQTGAVYYNMHGGVNNGMYEWNGTTWTEYAISGNAIEGGAITMANLAADVLANINGKNALTVGAAIPATGKLGDVWIQTNASTGAVTNIYECTTAYTSGGVMADWTLESAVTARSLGAPFTYRQSATPNTANNASNPPQVNDLWINTGSGNVIEQMTGGTSASPTWTSVQFSAGALAPSAGILGTQIANTTITGANIVTGTITANLINTGNSLNPNPYFGGGDTSSWTRYVNSGTLPVFTAVTTTNFAYPWCANVAAVAGSAFPQIYSTNFAVSVGDPVQVNGWFNTNATLQFVISYYDKNGTWVTQTVANVGASTGVWQYQAIVGNVPTTLSSASLPITQANLTVKINTGSAAGTEVFQATGLTVMSKVHGGLIEAGTITAAQINVADLIANGINTKTLTGNTIIGTGTVHEGLYFYNGTPSATNPPFFGLFNQDYTTSDAWGNSLVPAWDGPDSGGPIALWHNTVSGANIAISAGSVAADNQYIALSTGSVLERLPALIEVNDTGTTNANQGYLTVTSPGAATTTQQGNFSFIKMYGGSYDGTQAPYLLSGAAGQNLSTLTPIYFAPMYATNPTSGAKETWHNMTLAGGWTVSGTGYAQYKMLPDGNVMVRFAGLTPGTRTDGTTIWVPPTGYVPTYTGSQSFPVSAGFSVAPTTSNTPEVVIKNTPALQVFNLSTGTVSSIAGSFIYPLD